MSNWWETDGKNGNEKVLEFSPVFHVNGDYKMTIANTVHFSNICVQGEAPWSSGECQGLTVWAMVLGCEFNSQVA